MLYASKLTQKLQIQGISLLTAASTIISSSYHAPLQGEAFFIIITPTAAGALFSRFRFFRSLLENVKNDPKTDPKMDDGKRLDSPSLDVA